MCLNADVVISSYRIYVTYFVTCAAGQSLKSEYQAQKMRYIIAISLLTLISVYGHISGAEMHYGDSIATDVQSGDAILHRGASGVGRAVRPHIDGSRTKYYDSINDLTGGEVKEVIVYGERNPFKEVIPSQTLTGEILEGLNSHSVADAVRYFSGVQLKDYGGVGGVKTLDIRSMGTNHLGVFYDGIQLGNAQNGQIDLGKFSLDNIESISLYNGQKSNIFQGARDFGSAGTIYITTRRPRFKDGRSTNLNITYRTGSFGLQNPSFRIEQRLSDAVTAAINAEFIYANGRYKFRYRRKMPDGTLAWDTTSTRRNGDIRSYRIEGTIYGNYRLSHWYLKMYFYDSERGIPGAIVNNVWKNSQRQWDRNFFTQGCWQHRFSDSFESRINAKYARDYMHYLNPDTTLMYINNKFYQDEVYVSSANCLNILPGWDADLSVDYQWNHLKSTLVNFSYPQRHTLMAALATSWRYGPLRAQASVLYTYVHDLSHAINNGIDKGVRTKNLSRFTPAVFVSYKPWQSEDLTFRAFYKRVFRMPTFNDLYYTDVGNVELRPEYATQYNVGSTWSRGFSSSVFRYMQISTDAYHNRISDKIIAVPKGTGQYRWMMMNIGRVRIYGIDVSGQAEIGLPADILLNIRLNYTYQRALDYSTPEDNIPPAGTYKGQIAYIPRHSGSVIGELRWRNLQLNYSFIYVGERYHNSSNIPANYELPWYTHDIAASYKFHLGRTQWKATLEVNNLFNQQYEVISNYPMPGRNYKVIIQFDI